MLPKKSVTQNYLRNVTFWQSSSKTFKLAKVFLNERFPNLFKTPNPSGANSPKTYFLTFLWVCWAFLSALQKCTARNSHEHSIRYSADDGKVIRPSNTRCGLCQDHRNCRERSRRPPIWSKRRFFPRPGLFRCNWASELVSESSAAMKIRRDRESNQAQLTINKTWLTSWTRLPTIRTKSWKRLTLEKQRLSAFWFFSVSLGID